MSATIWLTDGDQAQEAICLATNEINVARQLGYSVQDGLIKEIEGTSFTREEARVHARSIYVESVRTYIAHVKQQMEEGIWPPGVTEISDRCPYPTCKCKIFKT